ncbi:autotransporter-associated beta strand repeat-containing protein [Sphingomonas sp. KR3-1]|uniref:autotransporter-associated beta strand repeat-containing protein n=1 Tax=Sphingomonas sp. KR3-1 TaxID=3156611 RepID=UPI0032B3FF06
MTAVAANTLSPTRRRNLRPLLLASVFAAGAVPGLAHAQTVVSANTSTSTSTNVGGEATVTVNPGVTVTYTGTSRWIGYTTAPTNNGPVITNNGTILATATGARVLDTTGNFTTRSLTVNNNAGAEMRSDEDVIRIYNLATNVAATGTTVTINNAGTMTSINGDGIDLANVSYANLLLTNTGTINAGANGMTFGNGTIEQRGQITAAGTAINSTSTITTLVRNINLRTGSVTRSTGGEGITLAGNSSTNLISIENGATLRGATNGISAGAVTINSAGSITGTSGYGITGTTTAVRSITLSSGSTTQGGTSGINLTGGSNTVNVLGGASVTGVTAGLYLTSTGTNVVTVAANGSVTASGAVDTDGNPDSDGMYLSTVTLSNYGTISGTSYALSGQSSTAHVRDITLYAGSTTSGGISAIDFYGGMNTISVETGATVIGEISGGVTSTGGYDTLKLFGSGVAVIPTISNFEALQVNGGDWTTTQTLNVTTAGATVAQGAILRLGNGGTLGSVNGAIVNNGSLIFNRSDTYTQAAAQTISGTGTLEITGGTYSLLNANSYTGATTITGGALRAGADNAFSAASAITIGAAGTLNLNGFSQTVTGVTGAGNIDLGTAGATLSFGGNNADAVLSGVISGTGNLTKIGTGLLTLSGANSFLGLTTIDSGSLRVTGALASGVAMNTGTLSGNGTIAGAVTMAAGTVIAPGSLGTAGTLRTGSLVLDAGTTLAFDLGAPGTANAAQSDRIIVTGDLTLGGTLAVNDVGGFGMGVYRLIDYTGSLTNNGLTVGTMPAGTDTSLVTIQTSIGQQVNLVYGDAGTLVPAVQFWDGSGSSGDGVISGGSGSWVNGIDNWTRSDGVINDAWGEQFAVFGVTGGTVTVDDAIHFGGMQFMTNGYEIAGGTGTLQAIEAVTSIRVDPGISATISAAISGTGGLAKLDSGTLTLTGANSYTGGTVVNGGRLRLAGAGALPGGFTVASGAVVEVATAQSATTIAGDGAVELGAQLTIGAGNADSSFAGVLTGTSGITKTGTGTLILSGANSYGGTTVLTGGTLRLAAGGTLGTGNVSMTSGTTLDLAGIATTIGTLAGGGTVAIGTDGSLTTGGSGNTSFAGSITGTRGALVKTGTGTLTLSGSNSFSGGTTIGAGTLVVAAANSLSNTGTVRIEAPGTLQIGVSKTLGGVSGSGAIALGANTLTVSTSGAYDFAGTASGTGGIAKAGTGTFTLSGVNSYTGTTAASAGTLLVNGSVAGDASVASGATLGGTGAIVGTVTVASGGTLTAGTAGAAGTLTLGNLVLTGGANLNYDLGAASIASASDRLVVTGDVTLAGSLNITDVGQFGTGVYRLIDYGGTLTNNGIAFGTLPSGVAVAQLDLQTSVANQVNLVVSGALPDVQFWDGTGTGGDGAIAGGGGSWNNSAYNWTGSAGLENTRWGSKFAVFQGTGGTVTVDAGISYTGMQFMNNGYVIAAGTGTLTVTSADGSIRVDDGVTARIDASIAGTGGLTKLDSGTLILGGQNSYTGATLVSGGTLRLAASNAIAATSAVTVAKGATLDIAAANTLGALAGEGAVVLNANLAVGAGNATSAFAGTLSGTGQLSKTGTGVFTLGGTQSYSGGTSIDAGTLRLSGATVLGTGAVNVATGATLDLAGNALSVSRLAGTGAVTLGTSGALTVAETAADGSFGGVISGAGTLIKAGAGTLTLTGANTYTGGTRIDAGTLALTAANSISTTGAVDIASAGTLSIATAKTIGTLSGAGSVTLGSNTLTVGSGNGSSSFLGVVSGTGALTKTGTGTLTLAGANTYTGLTTISGGTLVLAATGSLAGGVNITSATGVLDLTAGSKTLAGLRGVAGAAVQLGTSNLVIAGTATETWAGVISGTGNVEKAGTNTLTVSGANSYTGTTTISGGILRAGATNVIALSALNIAAGRFDLASFDQTIAGLTGAGTVTLGTATLTVGGNNVSTTYDGVISGTGNLVKTGTGTLTLTAANTYSGYTRVDAGKLVVNGTLSNTAMTVAAGGRLGGTGTFASLDVVGTLTPGNSVGTITTTGNVTFRAGSVYEVETNATIGSDLVAAGGNVVIEGGTVRVMPLGSGYNASTTYQIVSAGGTLTGKFAGVTSDLAFLAPSLVYTANAVNLVLRRTDIAFEAVAATPNQVAVAKAVQAAGAGTVFSQVLGQDTVGARQAFTQLSGEVYAALPALALHQARQNRDAVLDRLGEPVNGGVWLQYSSSDMDIDADDGHAALGRRMTGVRGGLDATLGGLRLGAVAGHGTSDIRADGLASRATMTATTFGIYGGYRAGRLKVRLGATVESSLAKAYRSVSIGGFGDTPAGRGTTNIVQAFGEVAYSIALHRWNIEPFVASGASRVAAKHIVETGGLAALELGKVQQGVLGSKAGVRFNGALPVFTGSRLRLTGAVAVQSQDLDKVAARDARFLATGQAFTISGNQPSNTSAALDLGIALDAAGGTLSVRYVGEYASNAQDHGVRATLGWRF